MTGNGTAGSTTQTGNLDTSPQQFAKYNNPEESMAAYAKTMQNPRYQDVVNAPDFKTAAENVQKAGYATDPKYADNLIKTNDQIQRQMSIGNNVNSPQAQVASIHAATQASADPRATVMKTAQAYLGDSNTQHADVLSSFLQKSGGAAVNPKTTPWCASFANSVLMSSGAGGTGSATARSFLGYGTPTKTPTQGDVVVMSDLTGANNPMHGHVGFYAGEGDSPGTIKVLGGNQSGQVSVKQYSADKVLGYRTPPTVSELTNGQVNPSNTGPELNPAIQAQSANIPQAQTAGLLSGGQQGQKKQQGQGQAPQGRPGQGTEYKSGNQFNLLNALTPRSTNT